METPIILISCECRAFSLTFKILLRTADCSSEAAIPILPIRNLFIRARDENERPWRLATICLFKMLLACKTKGQLRFRPAAQLVLPRDEEVVITFAKPFASFVPARLFLPEICGIPAFISSEYITSHFHGE